MLRRRSSKDRALNLVTCLALHLLWVVPVSSIDVKVDYTSDDKQGGGMPDDVNVTVSTGANTAAILRLSRVPRSNLDFPLYTLNHDGTGTMTRRKEGRAAQMMTAFYQDVATDGVFQVTKNENHKNKKDLYKVKGEFRMSGKSFLLKSERGRESNFQETATSTTSGFTSAPSSSPISDADDEIYSLEVQKVQRSTSDNFMGAPPEVIVSKQPPTMSNAPNVSDLDSQYEETNNETLRNINPKTDQLIDLSFEQSPILLDSNGSSEKPELFAKLRRRRRSTTTFSIDVAAVVDYTLYIKFLTAARNDRTAALQNIREYFAFIFNMVDQRFQNLDTNYIIHVYLSQVFVTESSSTSPLAGTDHPDTYIISETAVSAFKNFVAQRAKDMVTSYDHAILFTAYDLAIEKDYRTVDVSTIGIGYKATLCKTDGSSVSVIEEMNNYQSTTVVAQVLAQSLSANLDGDGNSCSSSEGYILSASPRVDTNPTQNHYWQFSSCSVAYFTAYLNQQLLTSQGSACLTGHPPMDNTIPDVSGRLLGQEIPPDKQCQMTLGPDSKVCSGIQNIGSDLCHALYCWNIFDNLCYRKVALDGTTCGNLKICRSGQCVSDPQAPTADESCMFGDTPSVVSEGMTCPQFIQDFHGNCYGPANQRGCCKSCRAAYRTVTGCEYGDRLKGCTSQHCSQYPVDCCGTCNNGAHFTAQPTRVVTYAPRPTNQNLDPADDVCRNSEWSCYFLEDDAVTQCYDEGFNRKCCQFCQHHLTKISGCEYGDRSPGLCRDKSSCISYAYLCCQFCIPPSTTTTTANPSTVATGGSRLKTSRGALSGCPGVYIRKTFRQQLISLILIVVCWMCLAY